MDPDPSDWREARRFRALKLKRKGWRQTDIAEALGVSDSSVSYWMKKAREGGKEALKTSPRIKARKLRNWRSARSSIYAGTALG